jgi:hypothetical protein
MSLSTTTPSEQDLVALPYFALLALGARSARRVAPLFRTWKKAPERHVSALSNAISAVENLAGCPDPASRAAFWVSTAHAAILAANAACEADMASAPSTALRAADAAAELVDAIHPDCPRRNAARAVCKSIRASAEAVELYESKCEREFHERLTDDLEKLRLHASVEGWTDETGIPTRILDT